MLKRAWPTIRILLSIALLWKATSGIDWQTLFDSEIKMEPIWFLAALASMMTAFICGGYRWGLLMQAVGFPRRIHSYIGLYFAGGLINQNLSQLSLIILNAWTSALCISFILKVL